MKLALTQSANNRSSGPHTHTADTCPLTKYEGNHQTRRNTTQYARNWPLLEHSRNEWN